MHPHLNRCLALIRSATDGLGDDAAAIPHDGRWSVADIVEHLDRTYTGTTKGFGRCLADGAPRATRGTLTSRARRLAVVTLGYFPTGVEAPRHVVPGGQARLSTLLEQVERHLHELDVSATAIRERFGRRPVLDHPLLGPFHVDHWLRFHHVHTRHHQKQILARRSRVAPAVTR